MSFMLTEDAVARKAFGIRQFQVNWQRVTLFMPAVTGGAASYPVLFPGDANSRYTFTSDTILVGVQFSTTWLTTAGAEAAGVAVGRGGLSAVSIVGQNGSWYNHSFFNFAGMTANVAIQRNPGVTWPPPFVDKLSSGTVAQLYGSNQAAVNWNTTCTLFCLSLQDYEKIMSSL